MPSLSRLCAGLLLAALTALGATQTTAARHRPAAVAPPVHSVPLHPGFAQGEPVRY
ncbi:hypothetical protein [Kitasatospora sp. NPDC002040]|uniref:hypothetical protein n=1 Tax=Kitasatospora sp. NPDC002040 TaxID=3154661 RepID=UPI00331B0FC4